MAAAGADKSPFALRFDPGVSDADVALISSLTPYELRRVQTVAAARAARVMGGSAGDPAARSSWLSRLFRRRRITPATEVRRAAPCPAAGE